MFDYVGHGRSGLTTYSPERYSSLAGYADDVVAIGQTLGLKGAIFVGHSVSAMIGALATLKDPEMFSDLVMVGPSARYIDDEHYRGGFSREQIGELLTFPAENHLGWSAAMAPAIMGNADRPELGRRLENSFCNTDPDIARDFAKATSFRTTERISPLCPRARWCFSAATTSSRLWRSESTFIPNCSTADTGFCARPATAPT